ncbi:MAG: four helix bundle protein [Endomicrobia bacterium]|nr:four helix bundle protein [Endomicrobiia bacterium]
MFNFENLEVYKDSLKFIKKIYEIVKLLPKEEKFCLSEQLRRACISIASNLAEGSGRTRRDFVHFINIARASLYECVCLLQISRSLGYITKEKYDEIYTTTEMLSAKLSALLNSIKKFYTPK